ncbi:MAG: HlyD family efflux transporter periplasmic adaptor subunit [Defluviitaleaceae bacterium]|nr:HlyD family efflux transporter periplasmic adaptor subunit [Defluviitaleaceae bacterium]
MMKKKKKLVVGIIIVAVVIGGFVVFNAGDYTGAGHSLDVASYEIRRNTLESTVTAQGEVSLLQSTVASIENSLEVAEVLINQNDNVEEGQPLIRFNTNMIDRQREYERLSSQLRDTQLMLQSQQVQLNNMRIGPTSLEIENATLQVRRAEQALADAEFALSQFEINLDLQQREIAPLEINLANAKTNVLNAQGQVQTANTQLNTAENTFANTQILYNAGGVTRNQLEQAETSVTQAEIALDNARRGVEQAERNVEDLENRILLTTQQIEASGNQREQLERNVEAARDNIRISELSLTDLQNRTSHAQNLNAIRQQEIAISRTEVAIQEIQRNMYILNDVEEYLYVPTSGTVTAINVSQGALAQARQPLVQITNSEDYVLRAFVNERHAGNLRLGQQVLIEGSILGNDYLFGNIYSISNIATTTQVGGIVERVVPVEISVTDESILIPGVTLDITITTEVHENVVSLPILSTLIGSDGEPFVFVIGEDNTLSIRDIEIIAYADMYVEVAGISEGERIVLQPQPTMIEGMTVNPIE